MQSSFAFAFSPLAPYHQYNISNFDYNALPCVNLPHAHQTQPSTSTGGVNPFGASFKYPGLPNQKLYGDPTGKVSGMGASTATSPSIFDARPLWTSHYQVKNEAHQDGNVDFNLYGARSSITSNSTITASSDTCLTPFTTCVPLSCTASWASPENVWSTTSANGWTSAKERKSLDAIVRWQNQSRPPSADVSDVAQGKPLLREPLMEEKESFDRQAQGRQGTKRKRDEVVSTTLPQTQPVSKRKKNKSSNDKSVTLPSTSGAIAPLKKKPGRPLSTSALARSIMRDLAALHLGYTKKESGRQPDSAATAFRPILPPFPDITGYVDGCQGGNDDQGLENRNEEEEGEVGIQAEGQNIDPSARRSNKVAAKKHRALIRERMRNLEHMSTWLDKALVEYALSNGKLHDTVSRLKGENEALLGASTLEPEETGVDN